MRLFNKRDNQPKDSDPKDTLETYKVISDYLAAYKDSPDRLRCESLLCDLEGPGTRSRQKTSRKTSLHKFTKNKRYQVDRSSHIFKKSLRSAPPPTP